MHSIIERKMKSDIFTPCEYVLLVKGAQSHPAPYTVKQVDHSEVQKLGGSYISSIRPGRSPGDAAVANIRALLYEPEANSYKLDFEHAWKVLPQRLHVSQTITWQPMFGSRLSITEKKFRDLQSLKSVMPASVHAFYDSLPHS